MQLQAAQSHAAKQKQAAEQREAAAQQQLAVLTAEKTAALEQASQHAEQLKSAAAVSEDAQSQLAQVTMCPCNHTAHLLQPCSLAAGTSLGQPVSADA